MISRVKSGFSLVELLLVLSIMGVMAAIAAPRFGSATSRYRVELAARRVQQDLMWARELAQSKGSPQSVTFTALSGSYTLPGVADPDRKVVSYAVDLTQAPYQIAMGSADFGNSPTITFSIHGVPSCAGTVVLELGKIVRTVTVHAGSGAVSVQ